MVAGIQTTQYSTQTLQFIKARLQQSLPQPPTLCGGIFGGKMTLKAEELMLFYPAKHRHLNTDLIIIC